MRRRWLRALLAALVLVSILGISGGLWVRGQLRGSLPVLDGTHHLAGLSSAVTVTRDALGIPTVRGASREDVARATGFLHAQERFFQMDLSRRRAAGELSALVGGRALVLDVEIRLHRFRAEAQRAVSLMAPRERGILEAYTVGVNSGLSSLRAHPFEYLLLGQDPEPWRAEDCLLVVLSMFVTLQDTDGSYEAVLGTMRDILPPAMFEFIVSPGTEWDAPVVGQPFSVPSIPGPEIYDLRARRARKRGIEMSPASRDSAELPTSNSQLPRSVSALLGVGNWELGVADDAAVGSNNWVVSGQLTADGGALLANDMHLSVRVPNTWYRAALEWPDPGNPSEPHRLIGITLPGYPALVVGSNTHVAWGFTNTYADWSDIVVLDVDPADPNRYRTPDGWRSFERFDEVIRIAGQEDRHEPVTWTIWGPVLGPDHRGRLRAYRWVAHSAERLGAAATPIEAARSVEEALDAANGLGTPGQNMIVADRTGRIAWGIYGSIPKRVGLDGSVPTSWADGERGWHGWLETADYPRIVNPTGGRIWTANARVVDGEMLARLGDGSYEVGSRATMIRERLTAKERFTPADMLDIQLDTRAVFLARWRDLLLETLTPAAMAGVRDRARLREIVERDWSGHAAPSSAAYRFARTFREQVSERVMAFVLAECYEGDRSFDHTTLRRREGPIWKLVTERPLHLLDPQYSSWDELLVDAVDAVIETALRDGDLAARVWSEYNVTAYRHPLSTALPFIDRWLDMPVHPLPGDLFTIRMHWGSNTASQRMIVSPGREAEGIMHMPTGQSGHPLSPFYGNSHEAWLKGQASPFLPGPAVYTMVLTP
jgi:penicillin amidase